MVVRAQLMHVALRAPCDSWRSARRIGLGATARGACTRAAARSVLRAKGGGGVGWSGGDVMMVRAQLLLVALRALCDSWRAARRIGLCATARGACTRAVPAQRRDRCCALGGVAEWDGAGGT